jgi:hypothetical protein
VIGRIRSVAITTLVALVSVVMVSAMPAGAVTMTSGNSINVTFPAPGGNANLAADATITLFSLSASTAVFDVNLHNGTTLDAGARITAFGFLLSPTPTANAAIGVTDIGGGTDTDAIVLGGTLDHIPSINTENVCLWSGNNCSGGGNTGIADGERDLFRFSLSDTFGASVDISQVGIKWQGCEGCSFEVVGTNNQPVPPSGVVPEPSSLLLLSGGLLGIAGFGWRKRKNAK